MITLLVHVDLLIVRHQFRLLINTVHELLIVPAVVVVDDIEEVGLVFDLHLLTIVLQQGGQDLTVCVVVPLVRVVLELDIVRLGLTLLAVDDGPILHTEGTTGHLISIGMAEGLIIESQGATGLEALLIESLQLGKVEFVLQIAR